MNIIQGAELRNYSTMRLGGKAKYLCDIESKEDLVEAINWAVNEKVSVIMVGGGSNIVWRDEGFDGLLLVNKIRGFEITDPEQPEATLTVGAGEEWDFVVERTTNLGFSGLECLSLIPGTAGATPIQNVGAYGGEVSTSLLSVEAFDLESMTYTTIPASECGFGYRTSRFKTVDKHRFFITAVTFHLKKEKPSAPFYGSVQQYLNEKAISEPTSEDIRDAVISIRRAKLPDPREIPNCGSFFTNPIISSAELGSLQTKYPAVPYWQLDSEHVKLSAAWLIEQSGFKAINDPDTGISTWPTQPLVLVNSSARQTSDLLDFKEKVIQKVSKHFGVVLVQEPELLP